MRSLRLALTALLLAIHLVAPASADRFHVVKHPIVTAPPAAPGSVPYNTQFGFTDASTGWITFPLHSGNREVWLDNNTGHGGSDSNTCLSAAAPCLTWGHAWFVYRVGHTGGDHLMVAASPTSYTDNGLNDDFQSLASGRDMTYPNAVLSYDSTAPADTTKYGKLVGSNRPNIILPPSVTRSLGMAGGTGSSYLAVQGIDLDAQGQPDIAIPYNANSATQHNGIVFQNVRFKGVRVAMGLGPQGPPECLVCGTLGGPFLISKSSGYGQWSTGGNFSWIDVNFADGYQEQETVGLHAGWKVGVSRDTAISSGGVVDNILPHGRYYAATTRNGKSDFAVWGDTAADGDNIRGGIVSNYTVSINEPIVGTTGGFSNCVCEAPNGVLVQRNTGLVIGGIDRSSSSPGGGGWGAQNLLLGSHIDNFLLLANPLKGTVGHSVTIVSPCANSDMIDEYLAMTRITGFGYSDALNLTGGEPGHCGQLHAEKINITWANSKTDQLAPGSGNSLSSSGDFTSPWTSTSNLVSAMGAASLERLYNMMLSRPDLPWARSMITAAFTAHNKSQPLSGVPPPTPFTPDLIVYTEP
jgi:hypothetical protein